MWGPLGAFLVQIVVKRCASEKTCKIVRKHLCGESGRTRSWSCGVLKTRERTADSGQFESLEADGVPRTRFSCLKARWRIHNYINILPIELPIVLLIELPIVHRIANCHWLKVKSRVLGSSIWPEKGLVTACRGGC